MSRYCVGVVILAGVAVAAGAVLFDDLTHPEWWSENYFHDPRAYVPTYLGIILFFTFIYWCCWHEKKRIEELAGVKTFAEVGLRGWFSKLFFIGFWLIAAIRIGYIAHYEIQHPELGADWKHDPSVYVPGFIAVAMGMMAIFWFASRDEKRLRKEAARMREKLLHERTIDGNELRSAKPIIRESGGGESP